MNYCPKCSQPIREDGQHCCVVDRINIIDNTKYHELIMAVERKFPNETRHETALRYIREAEARALHEEPLKEERKP